MTMISDSISIIIPGYNEEKRIQDTLEILAGFCANHFEKYEIVFVDDGSTDRTLDIVGSIKGLPLKLIHHDQNRGKGFAVRRGMLAAEGCYRFFTDSDLPYNLRAFLNAMDRFRETGCDIVAGARDLPESLGWSNMNRIRQMTSRIFSGTVAMLVDIDTYDSQCGFKGFTNNAAEKIFSRMVVERYAFDVEIFILAKKMNLSAEKIPVTLLPKNHSKIKLSRDSAAMLADVCRLALRYRKGL